MIFLQFLVVIIAIVWGARLGGVGLGLMGGLGLFILTFVFHLAPTRPPMDVLLLILAVVTATSSLQAAGGLDYLVHIAERLLRRQPHHITYLAPLLAYAFTLFAGTGHVAYALLPIIAAVARESGVRPERPLAVAVIASQQAITASPISAATVALLGLTAGRIELYQILMVCIPSTLMGVMAAAFVMNRVGVELKDDPIYRERLRLAGPAAKLSRRLMSLDGSAEGLSERRQAKIAISIFFLAIVLVVMFGSFPGLRPEWHQEHVVSYLDMTTIIELVMLTAAALILLVGRVKVELLSASPVFQAGMQAVIAIFGIAWMGDTFFSGNHELLAAAIQAMVTAAPWTFAFALFALSILLFSQAATVRALMPLGLSLGIPAPLMVAMFPAVNGYFFIPNYPTVIAAMQFDTTGTTRIGRYFVNHSFMLPGCVAILVSVASGFALTAIFF